MKILRAIAVPTLVVAMALSLSAIGAFAAPGPVTIVKASGASTVAAGGIITYTVSLRNTGDEAATGLVLSDVLSANTSFVGASPAAATVVPQAGGTTLLTFNIGSLEASASMNLMITARVDADVPTGATVNNTATLIGTNVPAATSNTTAVVVTPAIPVITITKTPTSGNGAIGAGGTITYNVTVRNTGGAAATGVVVTDILDPATTFVSANPTPTSNNSGTFTYDVGTLAAGGAFSFTSQALVAANTAVGTTIDNLIRVTSSNAVTVQAPSAVIVNAVAPGTPTPTPTPVPATPTPSASPIVLGEALPRTGVGEVFVWVLVALLALTLWPILSSRKTERHE